MWQNGSRGGVRVPVFVFVYNFPHINMHTGLCLLHALTDPPALLPAPMLLQPRLPPPPCICVCKQLCVVYVCALDSFFSFAVAVAIAVAV